MQSSQKAFRRRARLPAERAQNYRTSGETPVRAEPAVRAVAPAPEIDISVIVCTRNRAGELAGSIGSMIDSIRQAPDVTAELVVVDNGSTDDTAKVLKRLQQELKFDFRTVVETRQGLSCARNAGLVAAHGRLIVFTDDDCHVAPDYIVRASELDRADGDRLVLRGGRVLLGNPDDLPVTIKLDEQAGRWSRRNHDARTYNLGNSLLGANMSFRAELARNIGRFDEQLGAGTRIPGGEDIDYVFRAYVLGADVAYEPSLVVRHFHGRKQMAEMNGLLRNYSIGGGALAAKYLFRHPVLIKQLKWDIKDMFREMLIRRNNYLPDSGFSAFDKVRWQMVGLWRYLIAPKSA